VRRSRRFHSESTLSHNERFHERIIGDASFSICGDRGNGQWRPSKAFP